MMLGPVVLLLLLYYNNWASPAELARLRANLHGMARGWAMAAGFAPQQLRELLSWAAGLLS